MDYAIEFKNLSKSFNTAKALNNVNLKIDDGDFVVIVGTSGCGKTTLLKLINGLHEKDNGELYIYGEEINTLNKINLRRQIGYVIQQTGLFPHMTVYENIACIPKILKWNKSKIQDRVYELLELVNLDPQTYSNRYPHELSGGQQQRVGIARALAADPKLLLMDEPFGSIDAITRNELQNELIRIQKKSKKTILFVSHDISEAIKLGNKIIVMDKGHVVQYDTPYNIVHFPNDKFVKSLIYTFNSFQKIFDSIEISDVS